LSPEEVAPPAPYDTPADRAPDPSDAGPDAARDAATDGARREAGIDAGAPIPLRPGMGGSLSVFIEGLSFDSGDVPRAPAALERIKKDFARCALGENGSIKGDATLELRFLVRAPGRAEGVDVIEAKGMSSDIARCVTNSLAGRPVGAPTSDPVAVALTVRFKMTPGSEKARAVP
jgi:hypothetical protein